MRIGWKPGVMGRGVARGALFALKNSLSSLGCGVAPIGVLRGLKRVEVLSIKEETKAINITRMWLKP
jgi:hypothetical protein